MPRSPPSPPPKQQPHHLPPTPSTALLLQRRLLNRRLQCQRLLRSDFSNDIARQINEKTHVDIASHGAVAKRLRDNPKVRFDGERYSYRRMHAIKGKDELLSLITSFPDGLPASEVEGAYPSVLDDPNDPRSRMEVDAELKKMFHEVKLPREMLDIEKEPRKNGEKPATDTAKRRAAEQIEGRKPEPEKARKKPGGITSRTKLTNAHLPGLFDLPVKSRMLHGQW